MGAGIITRPLHIKHYQEFIPARPGAPGQSAVMRMIEVYNRLASTPDLQEKLLLVLAIRRKDLPSDLESDH